MDTKKILFLGSSHTFNVGLHTFRYMDYNSLRNHCIRPYEPKMNEDDYKFILENRWTKLVSNHFNSIEVNIAQAGGSPAYELDKLLKLEESGELENVDYIFFEFFSIYRLEDRYFHSEKYNDLPRTPVEIEEFLKNPNSDSDLKNKIENWLINFDPYEFMDKTFEKLYQTIKRLNNKKFIILLWGNTGTAHNDFDFEKNKKYDWIKNYSPIFPLKNDKNNYIINDWLIENKLTIEQDHPFWGSDMGSDLHVSLNGAKLISEKLIKYIDTKYGIS